MTKQTPRSLEPTSEEEIEIAGRALAEWVGLCCTKSVDPSVSISPMILSILGPTVQRSRVNLADDDWRDLRDHPVLMQWIQAASDDALIGKVYQTGGKNRSDGERALMRAAETFANEFLSVPEDFDEERIKTQAVAYWRDIAEEYEHLEFGASVFPVPGLGPVEKIDLGSGITLRGIDQEWAQERFIEPENIPDGSVAIVAEVRWKRSPLTYARLEAADVFEQALIGLRIAMPNSYRVGPGYRLKLSGRKVMARSAEYAHGTRSLLGPPQVVSFQLSSDEIAELQIIGNAIVTLLGPLEFPDLKAGNGTGGVAIRAFNASFRPRKWQDVVLDSSTALEALFMAGRDELKYRTSMRAALLLGANSVDANAVYDTVRAFYDLRSAIIHGMDNPTKDLGKVIGASPDSSINEAWSPGQKAATIGRNLVAKILDAYLHLEFQGESPFSPSFGDKLDRSAFDDVTHQSLLSKAGVLPRTD